jgi:uncharacterized membrane protein YfcA
MTFFHAISLFGVAVVAGALNSVAGGGGFLCFPALLLGGVSPVSANATTTLALWPGIAASAAAYRGVLAGHRRLMLPMMITGLIGGGLGALILLKTPQATFMRLVPWLMLTATLLLALSGRLASLVGAQTLHTATQSRRSLAIAAAIQLVISIYLSYFGGGAGIAMMAVFAMMGVSSIHALNALKAVMAAVCSGIAVIAFIAAKAVVWPQALLMIAGTVVGGYSGAWCAQKLPPQYVRGLAIGVGAAMTVYFFIRA